MSILFSEVTLKSESGQQSFLVRGVPNSVFDLFNYTAYEDYVSGIDGAAVVRAHADVYLYGEEKPFIATIEEVAYMNMRIEKDPEFLHRHCRKVNETDFGFRVGNSHSDGSEKGKKLVGRIDYLGSDGKIGESVEYTDEGKFIDKIKEENWYGVPMHIALYKDDSGETIDPGFLQELDPPNVSASVETYPDQNENNFGMQL